MSESVAISTGAMILLIDRNARNLEVLAAFLTKQGYATVALTDLAGFEQLLLEHDNIALSLIDISGMDRSIWRYCEMLSERDIPFFVISPKQVSTISVEGRTHGAKAVLLKPLVAQELAILIAGLLNGN